MGGKDKKFIRRTIKIANESVRKGDWPFGAALVLDDVVVAEGLNTGKTELTGHAEVNAIKQVLEKNPDMDFSKCILYSNFEPCPMCSFIIRDYGIGRVVFALPSLYWGGSSRWHILTDHIPPQAFAKIRNPNPPEVVGGVLADEAAKAFAAFGWKMHLPPAS